jgi:hypothetical protein
MFCVLNIEDTSLAKVVEYENENELNEAIEDFVEDCIDTDFDGNMIIEDNFSLQIFELGDHIGTYEVKKTISIRQR